MSASERPMTVGGMVPGLVAIMLWGTLATALVGVLSWGFGPFAWAGLQPRLAPLGIGLLVVGAVAAVPRGGWLGFTALTAGTCLGLVLYAAERSYFAGVYQGGSVLMPRDDFTAFAFRVLAGCYLCVAAGYWVTTGVLRVLRPRARTRPLPGGATPGIVLTLAVGLVAMFGLAGWLAGTDTILDERATAETVHRITITPIAITVDAAAIPPGEVTWLVTVQGDAPRDLTLVDTAGRAFYGLGTPPSGSVDFLVARQHMSPGTWVFTAGVPEPDPHPTSMELVLGRLQARVEVMPSR